MKTVRIFISSPSDVQRERVIARQAIEQLQRQYLGRLELRPLLWEELGLEATAAFQQAIDQIITDEQGVDIAVFILWYRLGSPLGPRIRKPNGSAYASGTEREFDLMLRANTASGGRKPAILFYLKDAPPPVDQCRKCNADATVVAMKELLVQQESTKRFIAEHFQDSATGANLRAYHSFNEPVSFQERLREHLRQKLEQFLPEGFAAAPSIRWHDSPFRGLQAFEFEHGPIFYGREQAVYEVETKLRAQADAGHAFVLIVGASGSGKSSLVRAGVMPRVVQSGSVDGIAAWRRAVLVPGQHGGDLCRGLAEALAAEGALPELRTEASRVQKLGEILKGSPRAALPLIEDGLAKVLRAGEAGRANLLLLVDQLEEVFTRLDTPSSAIEAFFEALSVLARSGRIWVLATLRSDFYAQGQRVRELVALKEGSGQFDLLPPTPADIRRMITEPALLAGLRFEVDAKAQERLEDVLRDAAAGRPDLLPMLEFALQELYQGRTKNGLLTFESYRKLGGLEGALALRAETVFQDLPAEAQAGFDLLFGNLVVIDPGHPQAVSGRRVELELLTESRACAQLIQALVQARLLVSDRLAEGASVVSVAHEALLQGWPRLARWIAQNEQFLRSRNRLEEQAGLWIEKSKDADYLLPGGKPLEEAEDILGARRRELPVGVTQFIEASMLAAEEKATEKERERHREALRLRQTAQGQWESFPTDAVHQSDQWKIECLSEIEQQLTQSLSLKPDEPPVAVLLAGVRRLLVETGIATSDLNLAAVYLQRLKETPTPAEVPIPDLMKSLDAAWDKCDPSRNRYVHRFGRLGLYFLWAPLGGLALLYGIMAALAADIETREVAYCFLYVTALNLLCAGLQGALIYNASLLKLGTERALWKCSFLTTSLFVLSWLALNPFCVIGAFLLNSATYRIRMSQLIWKAPVRCAVSQPGPPVSSGSNQGP